MRVFGIDWLEMFVSEDPSVDYSAEGFRSRGFEVSEREYGTKTMSQMFTLLDYSGDGMIEVRRAPRGLEKHAEFNVYTFGDSYIRLTNKYCYIQNPLKFIMDFLASQRYTLKKIYRIDLFTDFIRFDTGDRPDKVMRRIVQHKYAKVNQTHRRTSGNDTWTECFDNWISWGASGSMVSTKIYNKSKELRENGMKKPWILDEWRRAGFIDYSNDITKNGVPVDVYRLEFSIKGNAKGWIVIDKNDAEDGCRHMIPHSPEVYSNPRGVLNAIANLIPYYFKFRIYEPNKRKSLCKEKRLFDFSNDGAELGYRLTSASDAGRIRTDWLLDDDKAIRYLSKAYGILRETDNGQKVAQIIRDVASKRAASVDAARDYNNKDIF